MNEFEKGFSQMSTDERNAISKVIGKMTDALPKVKKSVEDKALEEKFKDFVFKGEAEKIVIESVGSQFYPPAPGQEIKQRLTVNRNGSVTLTQYFSGDYSKVPPTEDTKTMHRYFSKNTEELMDDIAQCFSLPYVPTRICDAGTWHAVLTNTEGERFAYSGSLGMEPPYPKVNLSQFARLALNLPVIWMFDGLSMEDV